MQIVLGLGSEADVVVIVELVVVCVGIVELVVLELVVQGGATSPGTRSMSMKTKPEAFGMGASDVEVCEQGSSVVCVGLLVDGVGC